MKVRVGFVSNSSTSSFLIYGAYLGESDDRYDAVEVAAEDSKDVRFVYGQDTRYLGASWDTVRDDETGAQFKARVVAEVNRILEKCELNVPEKFDTYHEAWRD